jgi:chromosome segregation ATPase
MTPRLAQLHTLRRIGTQRLAAAEQRLAGATRTERDATSRCTDLEQQRAQALGAPLDAARAAVQAIDLAALRSLPEQRAAASHTAARIDTQLEPANAAREAARQQRREAAHVLQRQRVRHEHVGRKLDGVQRRLDALAADAAGDDALDVRAGR